MRKKRQQVSCFYREEEGKEKRGRKKRKKQQKSNAFGINVCLDNSFALVGTKIRFHSTEHLTISYLQFKFTLVHSTALFNELMQLSRC